MNCLIKVASKRNKVFLLTCRSKSMQYNALSKQNKQLIDQMLRVDHAGSIFVLNHELRERETESLEILGLKPWSARNISNGTRIALAKHILDAFQGEYGANRIYAGQMAVLGKSQVGPIIQKMWNQEKEHLNKFNQLLPNYHVRPTALLPIWNVAGFALGAGTALLGKEAAMACTVAVETAITDHYNEYITILICAFQSEYQSQIMNVRVVLVPSQLRVLLANEPEKFQELLDVIKQFRDEEVEHHDIGLDHDAEKATMYKPLSQIIQTGCKVAIWLSQRV